MATANAGVGLNAWEYYSGLSGLTPATLFTLDDHRTAYFDAQGGELAYYQAQNVGAPAYYSLADHEYLWFSTQVGIVDGSLTINDLKARFFTNPGSPPPDVTPPTPGTVAGSNITSTSFDLTITGASDETALHATPYAFSTDNGTSWSAFQASPVFNATGKTASTGYTCKGRVRDAAGNSADTAGVLVTTSAASGLTHTFLQTAVDPIDRTVYTFAAQPIGAASADRRVVVAIGSRTSSLSSVTIGGVAAAVDVSDTTPDQIYICSAVVPTGTTADVVVTFTAGIARCAIGMWMIDGAASVLYDAMTGDNDTDMSMLGHVGDIAIVASYEHGTVGSTATWTGATERYDELAETDMSHTGADAVMVGTSITTRVTWSVTTGASVAGVTYTTA